MRNDGGPAFAGGWDYVMVDPTGNNPAQKIEARMKGMSLRDYFAAAALQGLLASPAWEKACMGQPIDEVPSVAAEAVYELADAMLLERDKS